LRLHSLQFKRRPFRRKPKKAKNGTIKILTNPGGLLLTIDGKPRGETLTEYRAFDLDAGLHNVQVTLPNGSVLDS
jgi:hypothetical protein